MASASDLMVGLLFVFIIMVVILSQRVEQAEIGTHNADPPLAIVVKEIGNTIRKAGVPVVIDPASGVITLPADTLFPHGSADLNADGVEVLNKARVALNEILPCYIYSERKTRHNCPSNFNDVEIETIFIEGHTDSTPLQRGIYTNWHLGLDRARAVYDLITIGPMQLFKNERTLDVVGISSYADKRPVKGVISNSLSDNAKNRRVELRFVLAFKPETNRSAPAVRGVQNKLQKSVIPR